MRRIIGVVLSVGLSAYGLQAQSTHQEIKTRMKPFSEMIGEWHEESTYENREGKVSEEEGTISIAWALDSTYLRWEARITSKETGRQRQYSSWITYDTALGQYRQIYLYSGSANVITEYGQWVEAGIIFTTTTVLNLPDGTTERLRNALLMQGRDKILYLSWASFDDAPEVNNYKSTLTRMK